MSSMFILVESYGLALVFANVFIAQLGLPLPAFPTLFAAASLAARGHVSLTLLLLTAVIASLLADGSWYLAGRRWGEKVLSTLFRMAPRLETQVRRVRPASGPCLLGMVIAKFLPGGAPLASVLAGATGTPLRMFIASDAIAAAFWVGSAVCMGALIGVIGEQVLARLEALAVWIGLLVLVLVLAVVQYRLRYQALRRYFT